MRLSTVRVIVPLVIILLAVTILLLGRQRTTTEETRTEAQYLSLFSDVIRHVRSSYVEEVDTKKLLEGAINGMLTSLDPHSAYLPPEPFTEMNIQITGSFGGVGIELSMKDDRLVVVAPIEDTPAERAGIKSNDHILRIDRKFTKGMTINDAVKLMRGTPGTPVTLTILREGVSKPLVFPLVRAEIKTKSVRSRLLSPGYGYIRISSFQGRTGDDFRAAIGKLRAESGGTIKGLVIDLRNNPGGLIDQAARVADTFIGEGLESGLIVYTQGRTKDSRQNLTAYVGPKEPHYPIVVMMNGGSASASEILAGALQDHRRAVIMGTQSFGKGSVQSIYPLRGGAGLKLTTALYYTPNGRSIQARGITPDILVPQLKQIPFSSARRTAGDIHEKDLFNHLSSPELQLQKKEATIGGAPPFDSELKKDYQLLRAYDLLVGLDALSPFRNHSSGRR
ncbi:MAG: S41 family peptidase [Desulfuromonadia bacterium]